MFQGAMGRDEVGEAWIEGRRGGVMNEPKVHHLSEMAEGQLVGAISEKVWSIGNLVTCLQ
jgi:hypothetical protein